MWGRRVLPNLEFVRRETRLGADLDIALGMFLMMALMSLKLELKGAVAFLTVVITLQVLVAVLFAALVVFRASGKTTRRRWSLQMPGITPGTNRHRHRQYSGGYDDMAQPTVRSSCLGRRLFSSISSMRLAIHVSGQSSGAGSPTPCKICFSPHSIIVLNSS